jgi:hypothetical protein
VVFLGDSVAKARHGVERVIEAAAARVEEGHLHPRLGRQEELPRSNGHLALHCCATSSLSAPARTRCASEPIRTIGG